MARNGWTMRTRTAALLAVAAVLVAIGVAGLYAAGYLAWNRPWTPAAPGQTPPGGLSRADAIRIAAAAARSKVPQIDDDDEVARAEAMVMPAGETQVGFPPTMDAAAHPWVWRVYFDKLAPTPTDERTVVVYLDYYTGEVLHSETFFF